MVQPVRDLGRRHGACPGRGQLDGEWHAVEGSGQSADGSDLGLVEDGPRSSRAGPFHEQLRGRVGEDLVRRRVLGGSRERPDVDLHLVGYGERLTAGRQDRDVGAAAQDVVGESGGRIDDMLAVVEEKQQSPVGEVIVKPFANVTFGGGPVHRHAECVGYRDGNLISGVQRRQSHPEDSVREVAQRAGGKSEGEGGLARAARPHEGQQPGLGQESSQGLDHLVAPDERPHDGEQVRGGCGVSGAAMSGGAGGRGLHGAPRG